jgi:hypothetical protein
LPGALRFFSDIGAKNSYNRTALEGETMKGFSYLGLVVLLAFALLTACETTRSITNSITGGPSSSDELFAQIPAEDRSEVEKATFDLRVAEEKVKLAEMKSELASLQKKQAEYAEDVASKYLDEAELGVNLAKIEAIDREGLGEKEKNINEIADIKARKLKIEAARIKLAAKRDTTEQKIKDLIKQIDEQETKITNLEAEGVAEPNVSDAIKEDEEQEELKSGETNPQESNKESRLLQNQERNESPQ